MDISHSDLLVGELVRARGELWRVEGIRGHDGCQELRLARSGGQALRRCTLLFPFDRPARVPRRVQFQVVSTRATRHLLADAAWSSRAWNAFHRLAGADVEVLPFQMEPALALLNGLSTRLLLADEVGLGKTIQAGLALVELAARGWARRVLILTPAGLRDQWTNELERRFRVDATVVDAAHLASAVAEAPRGVNPWSLDGTYVVSYDFVKRSEVVRGLEALPWDFVIVDEAHAAAGRSDRHLAVHGLCRRARRVMLLTATPHAGRDADFEALCTVGAGPGDRHEPILLFRRTREEVGVPRRRRMTALRVTPSADERRMHALLERYARAVRREAGMGGYARLAMIVLRKRALSSAGSLAQSVERRLHLLLSATGLPGLRQLELPLDADGETQTEDEVPDEVLAAPGLADQVHERIWLRLIADAARAASRDERKLAALRRLVRRTRAPLIVFTEYRDTLDRIAVSLGGLASLATLHGGLTGRERAAALARFDDGRARVLLATDTAGEGLNLQRHCRTVVSFELPWSPARIEQRIGRVDRLGQTARVHAMLLVARHTAELTIIARLLGRARRARRALGHRSRLVSFPEDALAAITPARAREPAGQSARQPRRVRRTDRLFLVAPSWLGPAAADEAARTLFDRRLARLGRPGGWAPPGEAALPGHVPIGIIVAKPDRGRHRPQGVPAGVVLVYRGSLEDRERRIVDSFLVTLLVSHTVPRRPTRPGVRQLVVDVLGSQRLALQSVLSRRMRGRLVSVSRRYRRSIAAAVGRERRLARTVSESVARTLVQPGLFDRRAAARAEIDRQVRARWLADSRAQLRRLEAGEVLRIGPVELALAIVVASTKRPS